MRFGTLVGFSLAWVLAANGQADAKTLTVGNLVNAEIGVEAFESGTFVDLSKPASATGFLDSASFSWRGSAGSISNVEILVVRRWGDSLRIISRSSVSAVTGTVVAQLNPATPVEQGDYIGISIPGYGGPLQQAQTGARFLAVRGNPDAFSLKEGSLVEGSVLGLFGSGPVTFERAAIVPVVARTSGVNGAVFRSVFRALMPFGSGAFHGLLTFRPDVIPLDTEERTLSFDLGEGKRIFWSDFVSALGEDGVGSVEVFAPPDSAMPLMFSEVYDLQAEGWKGSEITVIDLRLPRRPGVTLLSAGMSGYFLVPAYQRGRAERMNFGIRSLDDGAGVVFELMDYPDPTFLGNIEVPPHALVQRDWREFVNSDPNGTLRVRVYKGSAIIYQSIIDNGTNDALVRVVQATESEDGWDEPCVGTN